MWRRLPGDVREHCDSWHRRAFGRVARLGGLCQTSAEAKIYSLTLYNFWRYEEDFGIGRDGHVELRSSLLALGKPKASFGLLLLTRSLDVRARGLQQ